MPAAEFIRVDAGSFAPSFTYPRINVSQYREMLQKFRSQKELDEADWDLIKSAHLELRAEDIDAFWQANLSSLEVN